MKRHPILRPAARAARAGFTLIEVLLVVVIIGILVGVAVPRLGGRVEQAKQSRAKSDVENIGTALRLYELDTGGYPASLSALVSNPGGVQNWRGPYLEKGIPKDPWDREYIYACPGSHNTATYDLKSLGKDGTESEDDVANWSNSQ